MSRHAQHKCQRETAKAKMIQKDIMQLSKGCFFKSGFAVLPPKLIKENIQRGVFPNNEYKEKAESFEISISAHLYCEGHHLITFYST